MGNLFKVRGFLPYTIMIFLNAFVDLGHKIVIQNTIFKVYDGQIQIILTAFVNALILLPFIFLFTPAGYLSDKYPKNRVMRTSAWAAVFLTSGITLFYHLGLFWPAFAMTLLMAIQSAFYSPSKYGYIKELVGRERLGMANGVVQAATTTAILLGTFAFSILFEVYLSGTDYRNDTDRLIKYIAPIGWFLIFGAGIELLLAYVLPQRQPVDQGMKFDWTRYTTGSYLRENFLEVKKQQVIIMSIAGLSVFWAIGQVLLAAYPAFAKESMGVENTAVVQGMLACAGIGIMIGSLLSGRCSKDHIETGIIPLGSIGITVCLLFLPLLENSILQVLNLLLLGVFGGLFIIPLNALIQFHADEHELGRILAGNNFIQNITMLGFLVLTVAFALAGVDSVLIFYILMTVALACSIYTLWKFPRQLINFLTGVFSSRRSVNLTAAND